MKYIILILFIFSFSACANQSALELSPNEVQLQANTGELDLIGKSISIVTSDGKRHSVRVQEITATSILGKNSEYLFADIVSIDSSNADSQELLKKIGVTYLVVSAVGAVLLYNYFGNL